MTIQAFPLKDPNIWFDYDVVYEWLNDLVSPGVCASNDLLVQSNGSLGVTVKKGRCYVPYVVGDMRCFKLLADSNSGAGNPDWLVNFTAPAAQPRIDRVLALVRDKSRFDTELGKDGKLTVAPGTPTAGANLTNLSGAASVPANNGLLLLANVLVNSATIPAGNIDSTLTSVRPQAKIGLGAVMSSNLISHTEQTSDVHITALTDGTANEIVTAPPIFVDGNTTFLLHCYIPLLDWTSGADLEAIFVSYIDSNPGPEIGRARMASTTGAESEHNYWRHWIPTAGTKAFGVRGYLSAAGDVYTRAGPGLVPGDKSPIFLRLMKG